MKTEEIPNFELQPGSTYTNEPSENINEIKNKNQYLKINPTTKQPRCRIFERTMNNPAKKKSSICNHTRVTFGSWTQSISD